MSGRGRRAVFLDRDGTINEEVGYLHDPAQVRLTPGAGPALARLNAAGLFVAVVSNQSGLARGYFGEAEVAAVTAEVARQLAAHAARVDAWYHCPHLPEGEVAHLAIRCDCRKPGTGMLERAAAEHGLWLGGSFMVGDRLGDVACGNRAGAASILVRTGHDDGPPTEPDQRPDHHADDLAGAVAWILARLREGGA